MAEEKLRVGTWVSLITLAIIIAGGWMQVNTRISVLETQVKADHDLYQTNQINDSGEIEGINAKLDNIQQIITKLSDLKADKEFKHD